MKGISWINVVLGIWLIVAPFVLAAGGGVWTANDMVVGILLIAFAGWALSGRPLSSAQWLQVLCGAWLIAAPFVLAYGAARVAVWNDVICGIIAVIVGAVAWTGVRTPRTIA
jgi:hypothetical protein